MEEAINKAIEALKAIIEMANECRNTGDSIYSPFDIREKAEETIKELKQINHEDNRESNEGNCRNEML